MKDTAKYVSEFIGTYLLVLTVCCNVLSQSPAEWAVLSIASVLMVCIYSLGAVSGAHFNPAVTLAVALSNKMESGWVGALIYIAIQIVAGICAGLSAYGIFGKTFNLQPKSGYGWMEAGTVEILYTMMLCFTVLNVACSRAAEGRQYYGLAIGFVVVAGGYGGGNISGGAFNPAVAFGIDVPSAGIGFGWSFAYFGYQAVGAGLAALLYKAIHPEEFGGRAETKVGFTKLTAEFIGTFFLVLTVGLNVLTSSAAAAFSIAASLMCMIYAVGPVSGAHLNPAVTVAILLSGRTKIAPVDAAKYICAQLAGGLVASFVYCLVTHKTFALGPQPGHGFADVFFVEAMFTFVLSFVVLSVATTKAPSADMFGLAIGSCVIVGGYAAGKISGGSLNPAVSLAIDASHAAKGGHFMNSLAYSAAELVGAGAAAATFSFVRPEEYIKGVVQTDTPGYGTC